MVKERTKTISIKLNDLQIAALGMYFRRHAITIKRWAKKNHYALNTQEAKAIIKEYENPKLPE